MVNWPAGGHVGKAQQRVHHRELPWVIQFETWYSSAIGKNGRLGKLPQLTAVDEGFHHILLDVVVVVDDLRHPVAETRKVLQVLVDAVVVYVVSGRLGSQQPIVADVLLGKSVPVVAADHGIGQVEIFDHRLQLPLVLPRHFAAENGG